MAEVIEADILRDKKKVKSLVYSSLVLSCDKLSFQYHPSY